MRRSTLIFALVVAMALVTVAVASGCTAPTSTGGTTQPAAPSGGGTAAGVTVTMKDFAFSPATFTAATGEVVTFVNADTVAHQVKVGDQDLGQTAPGASVSWTAAKPGTYPIACVIHPSMTGEVTVK